MPRTPEKRASPAAAPGVALRLAVVGTAGHIDHGKTALVRRLTGVDTDRLPEEKKRGISIDLGFAPLVTPAGVRVGIVDVPGHERFVKNMLAGVGGIDCVLLIIAADEGVMPQTREHLAIVRLLGIPSGVVVLTKSDLAEREWIELVRRDVRALLVGGALADAPIVEFSAVTGAGTAELLAALDQQLAQTANRSLDEPARLPVDRVFTVEGFGTVVTGTLWRGIVRSGDALELLPQARPVRVRRVQVHGHTVDEAHAGQRTALALHGVERDEIERGDWLVAPGSLKPSRILDVRFELLPDYPREWKRDVRVRFHLGASERIGRLVLLEGETLAPGRSALAQIRLERPAVAARGDRFVIRSYSPSRTVGGGSIIEPVAERRRRSDVAGLDSLGVHESGTLESRVIEKLSSWTKTASTDQLATEVGESVTAVQAALEGLVRHGSVVSPASGRWLSDSRWGDAREQVLHAVREYAEKNPARYGIMKGELKAGLKSSLDAGLFDLAFAALLSDAEIEQSGERVRPGGMPWAPPAGALAALEKLEAMLEADSFQVPENAAWQKTLGAGAADASGLGFFLGRLVRVNAELTYTARQMSRLQSLVAGWFDGG